MARAIKGQLVALTKKARIMITVYVPKEYQGKWKARVASGGVRQCQTFDSLIRFVERKSNDILVAKEKKKIDLNVKNELGLILGFTRESTKEILKDLVYACADYLRVETAKAYYKKYLKLKY